MVQIYPEMVGCVGQSTNPSITQAILNNMGWMVMKDDFGCWSRKDNITITHRGSMPEFETLRTIHPVLEESTNEADLLRRMYLLNPDRSVHGGIKDFIARINYGDYCAVINDDDVLWLMTAGTHIHVVDLRETLGQIFFFPTPNVFRVAIEKYKSYIPNDLVIIEMPDNQVWRLQYARENVPNSDWEWRIRKYKITKTKYFECGTEHDPIYGDK